MKKPEKSGQEIVDLLKEKFRENIVDVDERSTPFKIRIVPAVLEEVCNFLYEDPGTYFDYLACLTGIDNGPDDGTMEVIYNLTSIPHNAQIMLQVVLEDRENPSVRSVSHIWRTANWHEREAYDLFGIKFEGHPDLRRILLPADWEGFPLRKDYEHQEYYHGVKVEYEQ